MSEGGSGGPIVRDLDDFAATAARILGRPMAVLVSGAGEAIEVLGAHGTDAGRLPESVLQAIRTPSPEQPRLVRSSSQPEEKCKDKVVAAPVASSGRTDGWVAAFGPSSRGRHQESPSDLEMLVRLAARLLQGRHATERCAQIAARRTFLSELETAIQALKEPSEILSVGTDLIGRKFEALRAGMGSQTADGKRFAFETGFVNGLPPLLGVFDAKTFGLNRKASAGAVRFPTDSSISVPVVEGARLVALAYVHLPEGSALDRDDTEMLEEAVARIWRAEQRSRADKAVRASEARFRMVLESSTDGFMALDDNWRLIVFNSSAEMFFGKSRHQVAERSFFDVFPAEGNSEFERRVANVMATSRRDTFETSFKSRPDRVLDLRVAPLPGGGAGIAFTDVTERRRADAILRDREAHLTALYAHSEAGFAETDAQGRFVAVNDRFCTIVGRSREKVLETTMQEITHPDDLHASLSGVERLLSNGVPFSIQKRYLRPDGTHVRVANGIALIRSLKEKPTTLAVVIETPERNQT